jgi:hypothetical protein
VGNKPKIQETGTGYSTETAEYPARAEARGNSAGQGRAGKETPPMQL